MRRRWVRMSVFSVIGYFVSVLAGCALTAPFDVVTNVGPASEYEGLHADPDRPTVVVLQHGICRSSWSLWRLERTLEAHGYEVINPSYSSTQGYIEEHAEVLELAIEKFLAAREGPTPRLCFIGHSMGGLVIRAYLDRPRAREAHACVFVATPQRGAALADARQDFWGFRLFLGGQAGLQLRTGSPIYEQLGRVPCPRIGTIRGASGEADGGNDDIPGDDDGTVGVDEAQLPEQTDAIAVPVGHTRIAWYDGTMHQVLYFLKHSRFDHAPQ